MSSREYVEKQTIVEILTNIAKTLESIERSLGSLTDIEVARYRKEWREG